MSFGFGVGDFIATGELCFKLYSRVYRVSRDAPEEIRCLHNELSLLRTTIDILVQEVNNPNSLIGRCGQDRVRHANDIMGEIKITLEKIEKLLRRYRHFIGQAGRLERNKIQRIWDKVKYTSEIRAINDLRSLACGENIAISTPTLRPASGSYLQSEMSKFFMEQAETSGQPWSAT